MYLYQDAISIIKAFEGFNEKAYPDQVTGKDPYTLGYGTQFYPDGSQVKQGHRCTKEKALEYLFFEINVIADELDKLNLGLDLAMKQGLISFIHSVGWDSFLYSSIIACDCFAVSLAYSSRMARIRGCTFLIRAIDL